MAGFVTETFFLEGRKPGRERSSEEGPQGSGDATPGFEGKRMDLRSERTDGNHRRQPGASERPSREKAMTRWRTS
jgi:hypothetical protein